MKSLFDMAGRKSAAERALRKLGVAYERQEDGTVFVPGDIDLSGKGLEALPDLSAVVVKGVFNCKGNKLASLDGAPRLFNMILSDFGNFGRWEDIPKNLHSLHDRISQLSKGASILTRPVAVPKTAKFRKQPAR